MARGGGGGGGERGGGGGWTHPSHRVLRFIN